MLKTLFTALVCLCCTPLFAQNLLSNSNFAQRTGCPDGQDRMAYCNHWRSATAASPDYYNSCFDTTIMWGLGPDVPQSMWAYQSSNSNSYAGMYGFQWGYREYIATTFSPLVPGAIYRVTMNVSLADSVGHASAGYGIFFYKDAKPDSNTTDRINVTPQIDYTSYGMIYSDTTWTTLTATFTADSAYTNLVIGNFHHDTDNLITMIRWAWGFSYYLIDSVSVEWIGGATSVFDKNNAVAGISVTPNPVVDKCTFSINNAFNTPTSYNVTILNALGAPVIRKEAITSQEITVYRGDLPPGIYYYLIENSGHVINRGKLLFE